MKKYDLYDFDKTIYPTDSETMFTIYCILSRPYLLIMLPWILFCLACFFLGLGEHFKGKAFSYMRFINGPKMIEKFWKHEEKRIYPFFKNRTSDRPVVVCSASPDFLLQPICDKLGVDILISTHMDIKTGKMLCPYNCKRQSKTYYINEKMPNAEFADVYSDALRNDLFIFELGERCFKAKHGKITEMSIEEIRAKSGK